MKTRCPECQTIFRVTPEQLKARAGKVRCGQCHAVFNALDHLLDEPLADPHPASYPAPQPVPQPIPQHEPEPEPRPEPPAALPENAFPVINMPEDDGQPEAPEWQPPPEVAPPRDVSLEILLAAPGSMTEPRMYVETDLPRESIDADEQRPMSQDEVLEFGLSNGLILPRETNEIPGYNRWSAGVVSAPIALPEEKAARWPFVLVTLLLTLALAGQLVFHFRSELVIAAPDLRPAVEAFCRLLDADIPLPRRAELVSIEASDLQADPSRANLLVLNATLRNRAAFGQAYPSLELSLTDTQDTAIARRVFSPSEYLSAKFPVSEPFAANADIPVRLWIEAKNISAAGYRLYVFYP
jgi:predicted Zn finger-like uncharacterized protein